MQKSVERLIELRRVMFSDVIQSDGPAQHMRLASWLATSIFTSTTPSGTWILRDKQVAPWLPRPNYTASEETIIMGNPASPILQCQSKILLESPNKYSLILFFTHSGKPTIYEEAMKLADYPNWPLESEIHSITWDLIQLLNNRWEFSCRWVFRLKKTCYYRSLKYKTMFVA